MQQRNLCIYASSCPGHQTGTYRKMSAAMSGGYGVVQPSRAIFFHFHVKGSAAVVHPFHLEGKGTGGDSKLKQMTPLDSESFGFEGTCQINVMVYAHTQYSQTRADTCRHMYVHMQRSPIITGIHWLVKYATLPSSGHTH